MAVETRRGVDKLSWQGLKDAWYPPETAKPYRILTCVSKSVEVALALGCLAGVMTGYHPDLHFNLIIGSAAGAAALSVNTALDVFTTLNNRERNAKQEQK